MTSSDSLTRALDSALSRDPQFVLVQGPPNSGKSALLGSFARETAWRKHRIRAFLIRPGDRPEYHPVRQALSESRGRAARGLAALRRAEHGGRMHLVAEWIGTIPVIGNFVAALIATTRALDRRRNRHPSTARVSDDALALYAIARKGPLVLLFDDIDTLDPPAAHELATFIDNIPPGLQLLVVAVARPSPDTVNPALEMIGHLRRAFTRVTMSDSSDVVGMTAFNALDDATASLLRAAGAIGASFDSLSLARAVGRDELAVEDALAIAVRREIIRVTGEVVLEDGESGSAYEFTSPGLRDAILQQDDSSPSH
jgi:hypothetical protein